MQSFSPRPVKSKKPMQPKDPDTGSLDMFKVKKNTHIWPVLSKFDFFMFLIWLTSCANDVQVQSSFVCKSPGAALKLAAMKRMRDAGWTTVSSSDKKKKKVTDKIFAWNCLHQKCDFILFLKKKNVHMIAFDWLQFLLNKQKYLYYLFLVLSTQFT